MQGNTYEKILVGGGPALRMFDSAAIASPKLRKMIEGIAKKAKLPLQCGSGGGATDGAVIQEFGALVMPIGIPMKYTHSPTECASIKDMEDTSRLLMLIAEHLAKAQKPR
jgi:endoglucanase